MSQSNKVTLVLRSKSAGGKSIERIFDCLESKIGSEIQIRREYLASCRARPWDLLHNCAVLRRSFTENIHVSGDAHYAACSFIGKRTRVLMTVHDNRLLDWTVGLKRAYYSKLWYSLPLRRVDHWTAISPWTADGLVRAGVASSSITVVPNPVDPMFRPVNYESDDLLPTILHIGTAENKNLERVMISLEGLACRLLVVGRMSPAQLSVAATSRLVLENRWDVNDTDLVSLYNQSKVVSFPSTYEGFGLPILEAQAVGRPVVTSGIQPHRWVAGAGALFVDPYCVSSIREGFRSALAWKSDVKEAIEVGAINCKRFSCESVASSYLDVYGRTFGWS